MKTNIGSIDRILRIIVGLVLLAMVPNMPWSGMVAGLPQGLWGWIGVVPLVTALMGWCPAYSLLGIKTCKTRTAT